MLAKEVRRHTTDLPKDTAVTFSLVFDLGNVALFTNEEIREHSFSAVVEAGEQLYNQKKVTELTFVGDDIIASVKDTTRCRVVISRDGKDIRFSCSCNFAFAGACEHAVAVMFAANNDTAIQVGIDWGVLGAITAGSGAVAMAHTQRESLNNSSRELSNDSWPSPMDEASIVTVAFGRPEMRLYLTERDAMLLVECRFAYNKGMVEFTRFDTTSERLVPQDTTVYRVCRSKAREAVAVADLASFDLMQFQAGFYTPTTDPRMWILQQLPHLADAGYQIYGQERLATTQARKSTPHLSVSITTQDSLFDCAVTISFDGIPATLAALILAVRQGSRFVRLSDSTSGMLPEAWIETFTALFDAINADQSDKTLAIRTSHIALAEMLCDMADEQWADAGFAEKRLALKEFRGVIRQEVPGQFKVTMRPYQHAGFEWFYFLKQFSFGGCLADDMGLGKTVQTLALLLKEKELGGGLQPSLIIVPTSLLVNWQREAARFAPSLSFLLYHGPTRQKNVELFGMADVVITTYGTVVRDLAELKQKKFHYIILDEAQAIKNPSSQTGRSIRELSGSYRLALSGTPIENNLSELWSLLTFLNPGMLGSYRMFARTFVKPIEREFNEQKASLLRKLIYPFFLRRTKEQVITELPPKNEITVYAEMVPRQRWLYDITKEMYRGKIMESITHGGVERSQMQLLEGLLRLRQICCHPKLFDENYSEDSGKFQIIEEALKDAVAEGHRVLVFSQFVAALHLLRGRIAQLGISSELLTGSTQNRQRVVDRFQSKTGAPVFFISLKAGGTGLNLTAADYVIHIDPWWNPSAENQASDRAYRMGQTRAVFVYKMITRDSIEERVLQLQEQKRELMQSIIQTESSFFKQLNREDVLRLFD